jgi:NDP-sugar pyrophosphorylase family protein
MTLRYHWEARPLGTAGALHSVGQLDETFLVMNGDVLTTLDFGALVRWHQEQGAALTIASQTRDHQVDLGVIEATDGVVTGYIEKPMLSYVVSTGVYVYEPSALAYVGSGYSDFPDVVRALVAAGERVLVYPFEGKWFDIGTMGQLEAATAEIERDGTGFGLPLEP